MTTARMTTVPTDGEVLTAFRPEQIVVATRHRPLVEEALRERGIGGQAEVSETLGLTLLTLHNLAEGARQLRTDPYLLRYATAVLTSRVPGRPAPVDDLDLLLFDLRTSFRDRYGGWVPTMGKNRYVDGTEALGGEIGGGGPRPSPDDQVGPLGGEIGGGGGHGLRPLEKGVFRLPAGDEGRDVRIAVLDTKIFPHPELEARLDRSALLDRRESYDFPMAGHGTFGVSRVLLRAPGAELTVRAVLNERGWATAWDVAREMAEVALVDDVDVVHLPLGCVTDDGEPPLVLSRAVDLLTPRTVIVAAAGNYAAETDPPGLGRLRRDTPVWPAALPDVVAVGASDAEDGPAAFSPEEPWLRTRERGVNLPGLYLEGGVRVPAPDTAECPGRPTYVTFPGSARWEGSSFSAADFTGHLAAAAGGTNGDVHAALEKLAP